MKDILKGELVRLSALDADELSKALARWNRDSEYRRLLDSGTARMNSQKAAQKWLEKDIEEQSINQHWFSIRTLADDKLLGDIDLFVYNWPGRDAFVGLGIGEREFWGRGYGTDVMRVILRYAFAEVNLNRVTLSVFEYNPRAIRSYEKAGYRHEGRMRGVLNKEGKRWDMLYMGILREEWMEQYGTLIKTNNPLLDANASTTLSTGLRLRPAQWADLHAVAKLVYDVCEADGDTTVAVTPEELKLEWQAPGFNIERDGIVATTADGQVLGYEEFANEYEHSKLRTDGYVHPAFKGRGIGTSMLRVMETRARQEIALAQSDVRVYLHSTMDSHDNDGRTMHENEGYKAIRFSWRMEIKLEAPAPVPVWPAGIELRPFVRDEHAHAVLDAQNESFRDHWGSHDIGFEEWSLRKFGREDFDPTLWMIAWDGDQIAGFSQNRFRMGIGWIGTLGVRRPWRKRGLGEALLLHSFGEFYRRGTSTVGLGVDAENPTGATRLYIKCGMHAASEFVTYEKELRPGRELEEE